MFGFFKHKHEWQYRYLDMGPERTVSDPDDHVCLRVARMYHLKFCKCGQFEVSMGGEEGSKLIGKIPSYRNEVSQQVVLGLLKDISYDLSMTFGEECNNYVI